MLVLQCQLERELIRYVRRYLCQPQVTIITNDKQFIFMCELYDYVENTEFPDLLKEEDPIFAFNKAIIDATAPYCIAYKPNLAFYESMGVKGWIAFRCV